MLLVKAVNFKFTQTGFLFVGFKFFLNVKAFYMIHLYVICYIYKKIWGGKHAELVFTMTMIILKKLIIIMVSKTVSFNKISKIITPVQYNKNNK